MIMRDYKIFKQRLYDLNQCDEKYTEVVRKNEHNLYRLHECRVECSVSLRRPVKRGIR